MTMTTEPERKTTVEVGDYFVSSWGYDETHVDFYRVVGITPSGKSVRVQHWSKVVSCAGAPQEYVTPGSEPARTRVWNDDYSDQIETVAPVELHRLRKDWSVPAFTVNSFAVATLWDGKPEYQTGSGWGR